MTFTFLIRPNSTYVLPRIKGTPQSEKEKQKTNRNTERHVAFQLTMTSTPIQRIYIPAHKHQPPLSNTPMERKSPAQPLLSAYCHNNRPSHKPGRSGTASLTKGYFRQDSEQSPVSVYKFFKTRISSMASAA